MILKKLILIVRTLVRLRKDDVLLMSFPKSGNTYVRILYCNYLRLSSGMGELKGFDELNAKKEQD